MCFEVKNKDLLGRIGKIKTKSGVIETPLLLPVINPKKIEIQPKEIFDEFKFKALMTNAYILKKYFETDVIKSGIHNFLGFSGVIMTDSGGYQILRYGYVDVKPLEIFDFQEKIGSDIGVILDVPTGWGVSKNYAEWTVNETLKRAREIQNYLKNKHITLWVGPIQGGNYLDLISFSARELSKIPFDIYAIGSPTEVMERYFFDFLVKMILTAKLNLPPNKPLHLFGAGHPFMFSFAVALGCDMFDSASYALYAKDERYLTETGTIRLKNLEYFPCDCPVCRNLTPKDLKEKEKSERTYLLMRHNLYVCWSEIQRIKQHIIDGKLWELLELRARAHPSLFKAFSLIAKFSKLFLKDTPLFKERGVFIFDNISVKRPEIISYREKLVENYGKPEEAEILLLLPPPSTKPFHKSREFKLICKFLEDADFNLKDFHICFYTAPFGVVPLEIDDVYPLSQFEVGKPFKGEVKIEVAKSIIRYIEGKPYKLIVIYRDPKLLSDRLLSRIIKEKRGLVSIDVIKKPYSKDSFNHFIEGLKNIVSREFT